MAANRFRTEGQTSFRGHGPLLRGSGSCSCGGATLS